MRNALLIGRQLYLRPLDPDQDASKLAQWYNNQELRYYLNPEPFSCARYKDFLHRLKGNTKLTMLGIALKNNNTLIGSVGLKDLNTGFVRQTAELYSIRINPQEQGKGYGTEATQLILHYGFIKQNLHRLETYDVEDNIPGWKVDEKLGFQFEGIRREVFLRDGRSQNMRMYSMLRREYIEVFSTSPIYTAMRDILSLKEV